MKIPNYDTQKNGKQNRKLNNLLDEDHRMLITGQSKCGQTNTLMHMLRMSLVYYDKICFYPYIPKDFVFLQFEIHANNQMHQKCKIWSALQVFHFLWVHQVSQRT